MVGIGNRGFWSVQPSKRIKLFS